MLKKNAKDQGPNPVSEYEWRVKKNDRDAVADLADELGISRVIAACCLNRGLKTSSDVKKFTNLSFDQLHDPKYLPDIEAVVERLSRAIDKGEKIHIYGDYDADGITSTALMAMTFKRLGANFSRSVPHRQNDGYDLKVATATNILADENPAVIMTVDCGSKAFKTAEFLKKYHVDFIVTDHHMPESDGSLPDCIGVVNPNRADSKYPFSGLAGVGVAYKVASLLAESRGVSIESVRDNLLEFVALGTVADVAPMKDENRVLVKFGCDQLIRTKKTGLKALLKVADVRSINNMTIGFALGPRINAIGRLADATVALDLMLEKNETRANFIAAQLDTANKRRQEEQERTVKEARSILPENLPDMILIGQNNWNAGICGLAASKLADLYARPALVFTHLDGEHAK